jgi:type II secretory pathway component PulJ
MFRQRRHPQAPIELRGGNDCGRVRSTRAFTLLELMLALALSTLVLLAITMAVDLHLRLFDSRRSYLEESQLARAVLRIMADDIRSAVVHHEQDMSTIETLLSAASGGSQKAPAPSGGQTPSDQNGTPQTPTGGSGEASPDPPASENGASLESGETTEPSPNTQELASTLNLPSLPGIYGNQYELQIDILRLPREETMVAYQASQLNRSPTTLVDIPSDMKTVTYYVQAEDLTRVSANSNVTTSGGLVGTTDLTGQSQRGLVRRELDRSMTEWAVKNANLQGLEQTGEVLAPEVLTVEFSYFDGMEWRTEWDSESEGCLPVAIQILLAMELKTNAQTQSPVVLGTGLTATTEGGVTYFRLVVPLPAAAADQSSSSQSTSSEQTTGSAQTNSGM